MKASWNRRLLLPAVGSASPHQELNEGTPWNSRWLLPPGVAVFRLAREEMFMNLIAGRHTGTRCPHLGRGLQDC